MQTITERATRRRGTSQPQRVVVVNGNSGLLEMLETVLDAGRYDMTFADAADHAYSSIRQVQPDLVILCMDLDEPAGFQLLSMLKLDPETQRIPIVTYANDGVSFEDNDEDDDETGIEDFPVTRPAMTMN